MIKFHQPNSVLNFHHQALVLLKLIPAVQLVSPSSNVDDDIQKCLRYLRTSAHFQLDATLR